MNPVHMNNDNDKLLAEAFKRLTATDQQWFKRSAEYIIKGNFLSALERELRSFAEQPKMAGNARQVLIDLCPPIMLRQLGDADAIKYGRNAWEVPVIIDSALSTSIPMTRRLTRGNFIIALGTIAFSREHALQALKEKAGKAMPIVKAVCTDFCEDRSRALRNAYAHGYILVPDEGAKEIVFVTTEINPSTRERGNPRKHCYSVLGIDFYLKIFYWFCFSVYVHLIHPLLHNTSQEMTTH